VQPATINRVQKLQNRVRYWVCHTDLWPDPTRPSQSRWPGDSWPEDPVPTLERAISRCRLRWWTGLVQVQCA